MHVTDEFTDKIWNLIWHRLKMIFGLISSVPENIFGAYFVPTLQQREIWEGIYLNGATYNKKKTLYAESSLFI